MSIKDKSSGKISFMKIMNLGKKLKHSIVQKLTENSTGKSFQGRAETQRILISRPNHRLGNLLLITPLVQEVTALFPNSQIDLFVSGHHAPTLFEGYTNIDRIISLPRKPGKDLVGYSKGWLQLRKRKYDLVINATTGSSSGRLSAVFANSGTKFVADDNKEAILDQFSDAKHLAKYPVYSLRKFLRGLGMEVKEAPVPLLDLKLSASELEHGRKLLREIVPADKKVICVFTNATGQKCLSETWWLEFYSKLKDSLPEYQIMEVLPVENISRIGFQAPSYYSKNTREMGAVISNTSVFITGDCGVMHLASASLTPTFGLFNQGRIDIYQPYGNNSTAVDTNQKSAEEIIEVLKKEVLI